MKIGARVLKTGIAITLSILASVYLIPSSDGMLAGIAAVYSTQPSVRKTFEIFMSRLASNTLGGIVAVIAVYTIGVHPIAVGIAAILTIAILNALKLDDVIGLAVVTLIVVMLGNGEDYQYINAAIIRVSETFIGVLITFLVNLLIFPPKYDVKFYHTLEYTTAETLIWIRSTLRRNSEYSVLDNDIKWGRRQVTKLHNLFALIRHEMSFNPKTRYQRLREITVYRQMLRTTESSIRLLTTFHRYEQKFHEFPDDMRISVRERIETLLSGHEQILMKFNGKVPPREVNFINLDPSMRYHYIEQFFEQVHLQDARQVGPRFEGNGVIHILSVTHQYEEDLIKLNRLVRNLKLRSSVRPLNIHNHEVE